MEDLDINSLDAFNDVEEVDENARLTDQLPPPPAGIHIIKVSLNKGGVKKNLVKGIDDGTVGFFNLKNDPLKKPLQMSLTLTIDEPDAAWGAQKINVWWNTMGGQKKISWIDSLLRALTGQTGAGMPNSKKIRQLLSILQNEPQVRALIDWEASIKTDETDENGKAVYRTIKRGMKNFPVADNYAGHAPLAEDPETGAEARTVWFVKDLYHITDLSVGQSV